MVKLEGGQHCDNQPTNGGAEAVAGAAVVAAARQREVGGVDATTVLPSCRARLTLESEILN